MAPIAWDPAAFKRAKFVGGSRSLMELHVDNGMDADQALRSFVEAVDVANDALAAEEEAGRELYVLVDAVVQGSRGPTASFKECEPVEGLRLYLETLSDALVERGVSGRLTPLRPTKDDYWYGNNAFDCLSAVLQLTMDLPEVMSTWDSHAHQPAGRWYVDQTTTDAALPPLLDWVLEVHDRVDVWQGATQLTVDAPEARRLFRDGLARDSRVTVRGTDGPARMRSLAAEHFGTVLLHDYEPGRSRREHLADLTSLLAQAAPSLRGGWVQEANTHCLDLDFLLRYIPPSRPLPPRWENAPWVILHLGARHVRDAYVVQVLNDEQLERTHDLDPGRWQVQHLSGGRHLVTARDPEPWLDHHRVPLPQRPHGHHAEPLPVDAVDATTLARAREDFGDAIITLETLLDDPFVDPVTAERYPVRE